MRKNSKSHAVWVIAAATAAVVAAGGLALGSNMGFKFNGPLDNDNGNPSPAGSNRMSFPLNKPYANADALCTQLGLSVGTQVSYFDPSGLGALVSFFCGVTPPPGFALDGTGAYDRGWAIWIADPSLVAPSNAIIVGSHDPNYPLTLLAPSGGNPPPSGDNWASIPYHSVAADTQDICDDVGPTSVSVAEFLPDGAGGLGDLKTYICTQAGGVAPPFAITVGRAAKITVTADTIVVWNHF